MKIKFDTLGFFYLSEIDNISVKSFTYVGNNYSTFFNISSLPIATHNFYLTNGNYISIIKTSSTNFNVRFYLADATEVMYKISGAVISTSTGWYSLGHSVDDDTIVGLSYSPGIPVKGNTVSSVFVGDGTLTTQFDIWANGSIYETFPGNTSGEGGGTGEFDDTSDDIDFPSSPTLSAVSAGFITLFAPTITQLNSLASFMWSSGFDLDTFKKLFADPMDAIIGLSIVPVSVPVSGLTTVKVGFIDTGISMYLASSQYATIDCGTLTPSEYWGSALDYSPYTKFSIYLPYIGTRELNTDDIMGKTVQVVYNIDILSGACTAMIKCGGSVLYEFSGACATSIPVTGQNWTQLITSCIQLAGAGIAVAASGGSAAGLLPSTANAVMAMKPNIQRTGAVSGSAGMLGVQQPYLIWELPRQSIAGNYNKFVGYPSNITALLSTLTGYTQIESVHLENIPATQSELAEIETLLKEGVII